MVTYNGLKIADCGFFINLKKDTDRLNHILDTLKKNSIEGFERFDAISLKHHINRQGSLSSHIQLIKKFGETGLESCLIIEDDIEFTEYLTLENILLINEKLKDDTVDAIWIGGCPHVMFRESDNFSYIFSKACAFGIFIKKSFYDKLQPFLDKKQKIGSADSFYNRMIYNGKKESEEIINIIENKNIKNDSVYDMLYTKQLIFNYPIVVESDNFYSNNDSNHILNKNRRSSDEYKKMFMREISRVVSINEIKKLQIPNL